MKKLLGILAISALAASAFAQGTIVFQNQTGLVRQHTSVTDATLISVPKNGGYVELMSAPVGTALKTSALTSYSSLAGFLAANPGWGLAEGSPAATLIGFGNGLFNGPTLSLSGIAGGASAQYIIAGWTGNYTTYEAAWTAAGANPANSFIGLSPVFTTVTGDPNLTPPGLAVSLRPTFGGVTLAPVAVIPEPSTFALAGLGAAALLIFRRRK